MIKPHQRDCDKQWAGQFYFGDLPAKWVNIQSALTTVLSGIPKLILPHYRRHSFYQIPKADLILFVQKKLQNVGMSHEEIAAFTSNNAISVSLQVAAVKDFDALCDIPGRRAAAVAIANVMTEYQARFLVTSLKMLDRWSRQRSPIIRIQVDGVLFACDQNGIEILPAPIDYLSKTTAHRRFRNRSSADSPAKPRLLDHRPNDTACSAPSRQTQTKWLSQLCKECDGPVSGCRCCNWIGTCRIAFSIQIK